MDLLFAVAPRPVPSLGQSIVLTGARLDENPAVVSDGFSSDELVALVSMGTDDPATGQWQAVGRRTMARHGASALDTEIGVTLMVRPGAEEQIDALLSQAMMRLALALAC